MTPPMYQILLRLRESAIGLGARNVRAEDLQELLYHFDRLDNEARRDHNERNATVDRLGARIEELQSYKAHYVTRTAYEAVQQNTAELRDALLAYQAAGFGNSTDFALQGVAYDLAVEALK